jgi:hypothetical protein|tara:strand:+ start:592 stop:1038 length:447 start_codon:yes stop_codon:yes gene_type:complete
MAHEEEKYDEYRHDLKTPVSPVLATFNSVTIPAGVVLQEMVLAPFQNFSYLVDLNCIIMVAGQVAYSGSIPTDGLRIDFVGDGLAEEPREIVIAIAPSQELQEYINGGLSFGNTEKNLKSTIIGIWSEAIVSYDRNLEYDAIFIDEWE